MKMALFYFVLSFAARAYACELYLPQKLLVTGSANGSWPFESKGCADSQFDEAYNVLRDQDGEIPVARLQAALLPNIRVVGKSNVVQITNMPHLIRKTFADVGDAGMQIDNPFQGNLIALPDNGEFSLHCHPCQFSGEEVMRLHLRNFGEASVDHTFQVKFSRFINGYKVRRNIPAFTTNLSNDSFEAVKIPASSFGQYLTDLTQIKYFKTNKTLRVGDILRTSDLVPQTLVKAGDRVELVFENSHIKVKSQALSRQNGGIGDSIEVWNQANGKKYIGIIKDHKSVVVEL